MSTEEEIPVTQELLKKRACEESLETIEKYIAITTLMARIEGDHHERAIKALTYLVMMKKYKLEEIQNENTN